MSRGQSRIYPLSSSPRGKLFDKYPESSRATSESISGHRVTCVRVSVSPKFFALAARDCVTKTERHGRLIDGDNRFARPFSVREPKTKTDIGPSRGGEGEELSVAIFERRARRKRLGWPPNVFAVHEQPETVSVTTGARGGSSTIERTPDRSDANGLTLTDAVTGIASGDAYHDDP